MEEEASAMRDGNQGTADFELLVILASRVVEWTIKKQFKDFNISGNLFVDYPKSWEMLSFFFSQIVKLICVSQMSHSFSEFFSSDCLIQELHKLPPFIDTPYKFFILQFKLPSYHQE